MARPGFEYSNLVLPEMATTAVPTSGATIVAESLWWWPPQGTPHWEIELVVVPPIGAGQPRSVRLLVPFCQNEQAMVLQRPHDSLIVVYRMTL